MLRIFEFFKKYSVLEGKTKLNLFYYLTHVRIDISHAVSLESVR